MARKPRADVRPNITPSTPPTNESPFDKLKAELLTRLRAEREACWRALEIRVLRLAVATEEERGQPELEVDSSLQRLHILEEEVLIAGGQSLADEELP